MQPLRRSTPGPRRGGALVILVSALLAVAGCSSGGSGQGTDEGGAGSSVVEYAPDADAALASEAAAAREVITTGSATLVAEDPVDAAARVATLTEQAGGRVELRQEQRATDTDPASARLTLRLPADTINRTLDALGAIGKVADISLAKEDVTATGRDLDARIAALETSTARLVELMGKAANTADLLRVEQELATRQGDLDALRAQRADLSDRVAMSTIDVRVVADDDAVAALAEPPTGFRGGLEAGWNALVTAGRTAAVVLGAALPWLAVAGALVAAGRGVAVLVRRRRGAGDDAVDAATSPADA